LNIAFKLNSAILTHCSQQHCNAAQIRLHVIRSKAKWY